MKITSCRATVNNTHYKPDTSFATHKTVLSRFKATQDSKHLATEAFGSILLLYIAAQKKKKKQMKTKQKPLRGPLICWDIYASYLAEHAIEFKKQTELKTLKAFKKKFEWTLDIEAVFAKKDFEALVLTDKNQNIQWVNKGFTKMTGFPVNYAIGKKPNFLQGEKTSSKTKKDIAVGLKTVKPFKEHTINYKKDNTLYNCEIEIFPLKNNENTVTHFLAFEKEIEM